MTTVGPSQRNVDDRLPQGLSQEELRNLEERVRSRFADPAYRERLHELDDLENRLRKGDS